MKTYRTAGLYGLVLAAVVAGSAFAHSAPSWWTSRGVLTGGAANDFAAANQGQAKWLARQAYAELQAQLPGGAGTTLSNLVFGFTQSDNYAALNVGQVKALAKPFYDRLQTAGLATDAPWTGTAADDNDFAMANVGQLKNAFSFEVGTADVTNGLILHYSFDQDTGASVTDDSGNGRTGTASGGAVWTNAGRIGGAFTFPGAADTVSLAAGLPLANQSFSVSLWIKRARTNAPSEEWVVSQGQSVVNQGLAVYYPATNTLGFSFYSNDLTARPPADPANWHHWVCTFDVSTRLRRIYRDGLLAASDTAPANYQGSGTLYLGKSWNSNNNFDGQLDDVRVYARVLGSNDVAALYQLAPPSSPDPLTQGLVLYYPFSTNTGAYTLDASGHGVTGAVSGATWTNAGPCGPSMYFDGNGDFINAGHAVDYPTWSNYSLSVWFLNNGGGDLGPYGQKIIDKTSMLQDSCLHLPGGSGTGWINYSTFSGAPPGGAVEDDRRVSMRDSVWHHCVVTRNGTYGEMWLDGIRVGTSNTLCTVSSTSPLYIGNSASSDAFQRICWSGLIDEVRIYNRVLTTDDVGALYAQGSTNPPAVLKLTVASSHGTPTPPVGTNSYAAGSAVNCSVAGSPVASGAATQFVCTGWAMTGNAPQTGSATNFTLTLTNNASLRWLWSTQYLVTATTVGSGSVSPSNIWLRLGTSTTLTAQAQAGFRFDRWTGDTNGCTIASNRITVLGQRARTVNAVFTAVDPLADSLILHYSFDQDTGASVTDDSGNGRTGTASGGAVWTNAGRIGGAFTFPGAADTVSLAAGLPLANQSFTIALWARRARLNAPGPEWLLGQGESTAFRGVGLMFEQTNSFTFGFYDAGLFVSPPPDGTNWHHWVCSFDSTTRLRRVYCDGSLASSDTAGANYQGSGTLYLGKSWNSNNNFDGQLDDVRVYASVLASDDVAALYQLAPPPPPNPLTQGLVLYYPFSTNTGAYTLDASGHGVTGAVSGATWTNAGPCGPSMYFDGNGDFINAGHAVDYPTWSNYSLSVWFLNNGGGDLGPYGQKIIDKTSMYQDSYLHLVSGAENGWLNYGTQSGALVGGGVGDESRVSRRDGRWHHCAVTRNGTNGVMWIDGVRVGATNVVFTVYSTSPLYIGNSASSDAFQRKCWSGFIDEVRIYDRILSTNDINALCAQGSTNPPAVLKLTVASSHGTPTPPVGTNSYAAGSAVNCSVAGSPVTSGGTTQFVCTGWAMTGNAPQTGSATNFAMTLTNDASLRWLWSTQYLVTATTVGSGSVSPSNTWLRLGTSTTLTAQAQAGFRFERWTGDTNGCTVTSNRITVLGQRARTVNAVFTAVDPLADSLILHYSFDQNNGVSVTDDSGNGRTGTASGGAVWTNTGRMGGAFNLPGTDDTVSLAQGLPLANQSFTIALWAKRSRNEAAIDEWLFGQGRSDTFQGLGVYFVKTNALTFGFYDNGPMADLPSSSTEWHHWVCTYDSATRQRRLYRDGALAASDTAVANYQGSGTLYLGKSWNSNNNFDGQLDDLRVYSRVLASNDVAALYQLAPPPPPDPLAQGLVLYYPFSANSGSYTLDASSNNRTGTVTSALWTNAGPSGGSMRFNGSGYITAQGYKGVLGTTNRTLTAWIKTTYTGDAGQWITVANWGSYPSFGPKNFFNLALDHAGRLKLHLNYYELTTAQAVNNGQWRHVGVTTAGTNFTLYIDGVAVTNGSDAAMLTVAQYDLRIGKMVGSDPYWWFDGSMDEVRLYDRTLAAGELAALYEQGATNLPPPEETLSGNVTGVWTKAKSPYRIAGNITVPAGGSLRIEPGVQALFLGHYWFRVDGVVQAAGTNTDPIVFTPEDKTNGWAGMRLINNTNDNRFAHVTFEYGRALGPYVSPNYGPGMSGAGAYLENSRASFLGCTFADNQSTVNGSGVTCLWDVDVTFDHCRFLRNQSMQDLAAYGSLWFGFGTNLAARVSGCEFAWNTARDEASAIGFHLHPHSNVSRVEVVNNVFHHNTGLGRWHPGSSGVAAFYGGLIANNTFYSNTLAADATGPTPALFFLYGTNNVFRNNIVWGNSAPALFHLDSPNTLEFNCIQGGFAGTGNISADPLFVNATAGDFHLQPGSPCLDAGTDLAAVAEDRDGMARPQDGDGNGIANHDIGAYESTAVVSRLIRLAGDLAFGGVTVGDSAERALWVCNEGADALAVSGIACPAGFSAAWAGVVAAGSSQSVAVTFAPLAVVAYTGTVTVASDASAGPNTIEVSGTGLTPPSRVLRLEGNLAFGGVLVGRTAQRTLFVCNDGNSPLQVAAIAYPAGFSGAWSGAVAPGATQAVTVTFAPVAPVAYGVSLTVSADETAGTDTRAITGAGLRRAANDFDGDGDSDPALFWPATGLWFINGAPAQPFGWGATVPMPGDYDGDGLTDMALYWAGGGRWLLRYSSGGETNVQFGWGATLPVPADFDGDRKTDLALFWPAGGLWFIRNSSGGEQAIPFGWSATVPVPADFDGDGRADLAAYWPAGGRWFVRPSAGGADQVTQFGWGATLPVPGDYDGDGAADLAVYWPAGGTWFIRPSAGGADQATAFGWNATRPIPADYDGDGIVDLALYWPASGMWFIRKSSGGEQALQFGWSATQPALPLYQTLLKWGLFP